MHSKKYFYFNTFSQYLTLLFNIVVGVILLPYYLKFVGIELYGIWVASLATISIFLLIDPGFTFVMPQHIAKLKKSGEDEIISKFLTESLVLALCLSCVIFLFITSLAYTGIFFWKESVAIDFIIKHLPYIFIYIITQLFVVVFNSLSIGLKVIWFNGIISHISNVLGIFLTIIFLRFGYGVSSFIYTLIIKNLFFVSCNIFYFKRLILINFIGLNFEIYRENAKTQIFATLLSELPKSLPSIIVGTYSPSLVSSLKITQSIPELARGLLEKPVYVSMPILTDRSYELRTHESSPRHILLSIWYLFICFLVFFILFNKILISLWMGDIKGLDISYNLLLVAYVSIALVSKILTYTMYSMGEAKVVNGWITRLSTIGVLGSIFLFRHELLVVFYFILISIEVYIVFKIIKYLNMLKIFSTSSLVKLFISIVLVIFLIALDRAGLCRGYRENILCFVFSFALLTTIFKYDLIQTRIFFINNK